MTDIAKLGMSVETQQLIAAVKSLDKLSTASARAEVEAKKLEKTQASASLAAARSADNIASAAYRAAAANKALSASERAVLADTAKKTSASVQAARAADQQATASLQAARANLQMAQSAERAVVDLINLAEAGDRAAQAALRNAAQHDVAAQEIINSYNMVNARSMATAGQMQSNFTNMAAQFQDIGVTAAMGMNPLMIGLQQGAQISGIFAGTSMSLGQAIKTFGVAILGILSPLSIMIIGLTAAVAAGIQMVDWTRVAAGVLNTLADILPQVAEGALYLGTVLAIAFAPQIIGAIRTMAVAIGMTLVTSISTATMAMIAFSLANPFSAMVLGIGAVIGAMWLLNDTFGGVFGGILNTVKAVVNGIIKFFAFGFTKIVGMAQSAAGALVGIFNSVSGALGFDVKIGKPDFSGFTKGISDFASGDPMGKIVSGAVGIAQRGADAMRGLAGSLLAPDPSKDKKSGRSGRGGGGGASALKAEITDAEKFDKILSDANEQLWQLQREYTQLQMTGEAAKQYAYQTELIAQARQQNIPLGEKELDLIRQQAAAMAAQAQKNDIVKFYHDQADALEQSVAGLELELETLGQSATAIGMRRYEQELLNQEIQNGIVLDEQKRAHLIDLKQRELELTEQIRLRTEETRRQREELEFYQNTTRGFFSQMYQNLRQGQSLWSAFGNAVKSVVDRIVDKLINDLLDAMFQVNNAQGRGGGGLLGSIASLATSIGSLFGGGSFAKANFDTPATRAGAGPFGFAKGGAFTNGVYDSPTMFEFAKGGTFGVMGEAGPEAVMPLKRGPDGSLGVQLHAMKPQTVIVQVSTNDDRFNAYVDGRIGTNAPAIAEAGSEMNKRETAFKQTRKLSG
jgi:hypothetical protein